MLERETRRAKNPPVQGAGLPESLSGKSEELVRELLQASERYRSKEMFFRLAETFQALGDSSRVQIVWALSHGEFNVSQLCDLLEMNQPAVSHHLRTLRNLHLVQIRKEGRSVFYRLDDEHIERLLGEGIEHVEDLLD